MPSLGDGVYAASVRCEDHFEGSLFYFKVFEATVMRKIELRGARARFISVLGLLLSLTLRGC